MPPQITYSGLLQLQGKPKTIPGSNAHRYPAIIIGDQELFDVEIPEHLEQFMIHGQQIELTLNGISFVPAVFALISVLVYFSGEVADIDMLSLIGTVLFVSSLAYWFLSFINSGHRIHAIRINDRLYENADSDYETPKSKPENTDRIAQPARTRPPDTDAPTIAQPNNGKGAYSNDGKRIAAELFTTHKTAANKTDTNSVALAKVFDTLRNETSKLTCPQCGIEALASPNTKLICGNCKVWLQNGKQ